MSIELQADLKKIEEPTAELQQREQDRNSQFKTTVRSHESEVLELRGDVETLGIQLKAADTERRLLIERLEIQKKQNAEELEECRKSMEFDKNFENRLAETAVSLLTEKFQSSLNSMRLETEQANRNLKAAIDEKEQLIKEVERLKQEKAYEEDCRQRLENQRRIQQTEIDEAIRDRQKNEEEISSLRKRKKKVRKDAKKMTEELKSAMQKQEDKIRRYKDKLDDLERRNDKKRKSLKSADKNVEKLEDDLKKIQAEKQIAIAELKAAEADRLRLVNELNKEKETKKFEMKKLKQTLLDRKRELQKKQQQADRDKKLLQSQFESERADKSRALERLRIMTNDKNDLQKQLQNLRKVKDQLDSQCQQLWRDSDELKRNNQINEAVIRNEKEAVEETLKATLSDNEMLRDKNKELESEMENLKDELDLLENEKIIWTEKLSTSAARSTNRLQAPGSLTDRPASSMQPSHSLGALQPRQKKPIPLNRTFSESRSSAGFFGRYSQNAESTLLMDPELCLETFTNQGKKEVSENDYETTTKDLVLCLGGYNCSKTVQAYDPSTNSWFQLSSLHHEHFFTAATVLDNKVIVAGGSMNSIVEQYDPETNSCTVLSRLKACRHSHALVNLNGTLFVIGGETFKGITETVEVLKPGEKVWKDGEPLKIARKGLASTIFQNCIVVIGGTDDEDCFRSCDYYNAELGEWLNLADLRKSRKFAAAATLDEYIYVFGGAQKSNEPQNDAERYDSNSKQWTSVNNFMKVPRSRLAVAVANDVVYLLGGEAQSQLEDLTLVESFSGTTFIKKKKLVTATCGLAAVGITVPLTTFAKLKDKTISLRRK